jgi:hypothetical protein
MPIPARVGRGKQLALFVMLIMGTLLHGISVADIYRPALARVVSLLKSIIR